MALQSLGVPGGNAYPFIGLYDVLECKYDIYGLNTNNTIDEEVISSRESSEELTLRIITSDRIDW